LAALKITHYAEAGIPVMKLEGKINLDEGSVILREAIDDYLYNRGTKQLIIEMGNLYYADSSGIGEIFTGLSRGKKAGCRIVYANIAKKIIDLLTITKLLTVLEVYPSVQEAARSFK